MVALVVPPLHAFLVLCPMSLLLELSSAILKPYSTTRNLHRRSRSQNYRWKYSAARFDYEPHVRGDGRGRDTKKLGCIAERVLGVLGPAPL
jgi:hypothetical protein